MVVPDEWTELGRAVVSRKGTIFLLGSTDVCKSTLARYLAEILLLSDTTGLVDDEPEKALKVAKIKAVRPDRVIAIERNGELEHVLPHVQNIDVLRLNPPSMAKNRRRQSRIRYREAKLAAYFRDAGEILLSTHALEFFFHGGRTVGHEDVHMRPGAVVGLNRDADSEALGFVTEMDHDSITLRTTLRP